jgi:hypothetical protein
MESRIFEDTGKKFEITQPVTHFSCHAWFVGWKQNHVDRIGRKEADWTHFCPVWVARDGRSPRVGRGLAVCRRLRC